MDVTMPTKCGLMTTKLRKSCIHTSASRHGIQGKVVVYQQLPVLAGFSDTNMQQCLTRGAEATGQGMRCLVATSFSIEMDFC